METEKSMPSAEALVLSLRAMGYDLSTAIADLIDNSISANASTIDVDFSWNEGKPWIRISDDGDGMDKTELKAAMRPGSQSPDLVRDKEDLGRFGLGLKTASWSQCRKMTVLSKKNGFENHRCWDLLHVIKADEWELLLELSDETGLLMQKHLSKYDSGTVVLWEDLDRVIGDFDGEDHEDMKFRFQEKLTTTVKEHLQMVFHRYLSGKNPIIINIGTYACEGWDPFLTHHKATEEITSERYSDDRIVITPFVLPHTSKMTEQEKNAAQGPNGWALQQGFYVYRQKRMIICGGYLDLNLKSMDHHRLCRIKVDITNDLDKDWRVDVKKATASPPLRYRADLTRIAESTRQKSSNRYRARSTISTPRGNKRATQQDVWIRKRIGTKCLYKINRKSPAIEFMREQFGISASNLNDLLYVIERTVPHRNITVDNNELNDSTVEIPDEYIKPSSTMVLVAEKYVQQLIDKGQSKMDAVDFATRGVFTVGGTELRMHLEKKYLE
jgi:hypothetical protein